MADQKKAATLPPAQTLKQTTELAYKDKRVGDKLWQGMIVSSQRTNKTVDQALGMTNTFAPTKDK